MNPVEKYSYYTKLFAAINLLLSAESTCIKNKKYDMASIWREHRIVLSNKKQYLESAKDDKAYYM